MSRNGHSVGNDVYSLLHDSGMCRVGDDVRRHDERAQAIEAGAKTWHDIGGHTGLHNSATITRYKSVIKDYYAFCRSHGYGIDPRRYGPDAVRGYMQDKIDSGASYETINGIGSAMNKVDDMMGSAWGVKVDYSGAVSAMRDVARSACTVNMDSRAYANPQAIINAIPSEGFRLAARLELDYGLRVSNCGIKTDNAAWSRLTDVGLLVHGKGGIERHIALPQDMRAKLSQYVNPISGKLEIGGYRTYARALQSACAACGETWHGTHGLRHNYARARYAELTASGKTELEVKAQISSELFHGRIDVVDRYLR
jgi:site-specific recombinase XerD